METGMFELLPLLMSSIIVFTVLAVIPLAVLRDARHKGLARWEQIIWIIAAIVLFPIGVLLYLLSTRSQQLSALPNPRE